MHVGYAINPCIPEHGSKSRWHATPVCVPQDLSLHISLTYFWFSLKLTTLYIHHHSISFSLSRFLPHLSPSYADTFDSSNHSFIHPPIHPFTHLSIYLSIYPSTNLSIHPPIYLFIHPSNHPSIYLPTELTKTKQGNKLSIKYHESDIRPKLLPHSNKQTKRTRHQIDDNKMDS